MQAVAPHNTEYRPRLTPEEIETLVDALEFFDSGLRAIIGNWSTNQESYLSDSRRRQGIRLGRAARLRKKIGRLQDLESLRARRRPRTEYYVLSEKIDLNPRMRMAIFQTDDEAESYVASRPGMKLSIQERHLLGHYKKRIKNISP